jgi:hypothetical protein
MAAYPELIADFEAEKGAKVKQVSILCISTSAEKFPDKFLTYLYVQSK